MTSLPPANCARGRPCLPRSTGLVERLCRELDLIHCVDPFGGQSAYGTPRYYRLHGRTGYRYRYTDKDLRTLRGWCRGPTYVLFNNVTMWDDARRFLSDLAP